MNLSTIQKGDVSEAYATAKFKEMGVPVLEPVSDNQPYDLVIEKDNKFQKVQVKTGHISDEAVKFRCNRIHTNGSGHERKEYSKDDVDLFAIYVIETSNIYIVPFSEANKNDNKLWLNKSRGNSRSKYAENFKLTERFK